MLLADFSFADVRLRGGSGQWRPNPQGSCRQTILTSLFKHPGSVRAVFDEAAFDRLLEFYHLKRHGTANGLSIIDIDIDEENPLGGHAATVALKLDSTEAAPGNFILVPIKTASGDIVFGVIEKTSRHCVKVALGRGFDEVSESEAEYAKSLVGRKIADEEIWHLD